MERKYCKCGCNKILAQKYEWYVPIYIQGHNTRGKTGYWKGKKNPEQSKRMKGKWGGNNNPIKRLENVAKVRKALKNKTWEEIHGSKKAKIMRENLSIKQTGTKRSDATKEKISRNNAMKRPEVNKKRLKTSEERGSYRKTNEWKEKMVATRMKNNSYLFSEEHKRKLRESSIHRVKETGCFSIGKNEKQLLDFIEKEVFFDRFKIIRQYQVYGYLVDGYVPELNLAIEIDEKIKHNYNGKLKEKHIIRQKEIEKEMNCEFWRIEDY